MSLPRSLEGAVGAWTGTNKLWFAPGSPAIESATTAEVALAAGGRFLGIRYDWTYEEKAQEGYILIGEDPTTGRCDCAWVDSFHNSDRLMPLTGPLTTSAALTARGSYPAPEGPDWGWRITIEHPTPDALIVRMHNIMPDGPEALAVEASYRRR